MAEVDKGLKRPATLPISITQFIIVVIKVLTIVEVDICHKILSTPPLTIVGPELMLTS